MKAVNYYIVIQQIKEKEKKVGGFILTDGLDEDNRYLKAKVISVGNLVEGVKNNDIVHYDKHTGHGIQWKDKLYYVIRIEDIVIVE